ncbi:hypothetical protein GCM10009555_076540 [Acrocarpospora macrocephala]|uniref:MFS transporter n=1 Tax=Acrocarpospora macrocephala TaxID=150177 RepID=A0A5M3X218_9ACTN|nr:MFS transporter [Acrocarpospora macrocephala]GES12823.1 hypothetical protein Amac_064200 [Acrocarpospora macrocephala]
MDTTAGLRTASFRAIVVSTGTSTAGIVLNTVAVLSYAYGITRQAIPLGIVIMAGLLPMAVVMPFVGGWLRAGTERRTVLVAVLAQAVGAAVMAGLASTTLLPAMYAMVAVMGVLAIVTRVALLCLLPQTVPAELLTGANLRFQVASQIGAAAGSAALVVFGETAPWVLFTVNVITFLIQAAILQRALPKASGALPARDPAQLDPAAPLPNWRRVLLLVLLPAGFCAMSLLNLVIPLIALDRLQDGQRALGAAGVVFPAVAIAAGILLRRRARLHMGATVAILAAGFAVLALADRMALLLVGVGVIGAGVVLSNSSTQVWAQSVASREVLHRWQSWAVAFGGALTTLAVLGVSYGYAAGHQVISLSVVAAVFVLMTVFATVEERRRHGTDRSTRHAVRVG